MLDHLISFAKRLGFHPRDLGAGEGSLGVDAGTRRWPIGAGNSQSGIFHLSHSHLLSSLPEATVLFISCRSVLQKGYMHQQFLLSIL